MFTIYSCFRAGIFWPVAGQQSRYTTAYRRVREKRIKAAIEVLTQAAVLIYFPIQQHTDSDRIIPEGIGVFFYYRLTQSAILRVVW